MGWTKAQQRAIDERQSNILVSAAAGSGKTAVLVERIIEKMTDKDNPRDIDEFLVVTFTKAAAAQMREKIAVRIEKLLETEPDNEHLMKQAVLVNRADITTIDSFCLRLVKENFGLLDIDADFSIGDPGIMELIKNDVLDALFDRLYEEKNHDFFMLLDIFGNDRNDDNLKDNVLKLYNFAESFPRPYVWLCDAKASLCIKDENELMALSWVKDYFSYVKAYAKSALLYAKEARSICEAIGGPDKNISVSESDIEAIERINRAGTYDELKSSLNIEWMRLKPCKGDAYDEFLIEKYKSLRNQYKEIIKKLNILKSDSANVIDEMKNISGYLVPLIDLVISFLGEYETEKGKRKLVEFSDVEHMAYRLVCAGYDDAGKPLSTELAKKISDRYDEIFIDEYQDSNFLQEDILYSVSGIGLGRYNMFMVGDVKQSIYRFRMARPDLFISKYKAFQNEGPEIKIELKNNFRSRENILYSINFFFTQLMHEDFGGIEYDESVALVPTKEYPEPEDTIKAQVGGSTEILVVDNFETEDRLSKIELEAYVIAKRIKELVGGDAPQYIYDEDKAIYRKASYRDIVILTRSMKDFGEKVYNILTQSGIPAYLEDTGGYFEATEIRLIMSLLSVVDNVRQDIPLAAVLLSPMADISENELALVCDYAEKKLKEKHILYDKCLCYIEDVDDYISEKLKHIYDIIDTLREANKTISISSLIWMALKLTDYYNYAAAMPMGDRRKTNINMLLEKADKFEDGSYKGLFNFLKYIDKLKLNEVDFGEASMFGDDEDVVRIITMHKSKGLEYPIVFASGFGKQFNQEDYKKPLIIHSDYYLASHFVNINDRYKSNTFIREAFKLLLKKENLAEEQRVLYVALTRAKEKLIITGCDKDIDKVLSKYSSFDESVLPLPFDVRLGSLSFLHWILACMGRYDALHGKCDITIKVLGENDIIGYIGEKEAKKEWSLYDFFDKASKDYNEGLYEEYKKRFDYSYPYERYVNLKSKMSISEIKRLKSFDGTEYEVDDSLKDLNDGSDDLKNPNEESKESEINEKDSVKKKSSLSGSERGTIVHKFMELLDFKDVCDLDEDNAKNKITNYIKDSLARYKEQGIFNDEEAGAVNPYKIKEMLMSELGRRMIKADKLGRLKKEQQFSAGLPADMIFDEEVSDKEYSYEDIVVVQGIIDAFFYEDDGIVLMDYKTDYADEQKLISMYRAQLDYYAYILEKITGLKVKEKLIYSFHLEKQISID